MKKTIFLRLFVTHIIIIFLLAAAFAIFTPRVIKKAYINTESRHLEHTGQALLSRVGELLTVSNLKGMEELVTSMRQKTGIRFTVVDRSGRVMADSDHDPTDMDNHLYRPEIFAALHGEKTSTVRRSSTFNAEMIYMSLPIETKDEIIGVLRLSMFMRDIDVLLARINNYLIRILIISVLIAAAAAFVYSRKFSRPIIELVRASSQVAEGDFSVRLSTGYSGEFRKLARSFNKMVEELKSEFEKIKLLDLEITGLLSAITEPLCIIDSTNRLIVCNQSFSQMVKVEKPEGRPFMEVIRSSGFSELLKKFSEGESAISGEVTIHEKIYFCKIKTLPNKWKYVVTFFDLTDQRRLEKIKKDFAVNVTHELKTPLAAVKGFVETLEESIDENNRPYLVIIKRNIERLIAIVDDLLTLSEIESKSRDFENQTVAVAEIADNVIKIFEKLGREKGLEVILEKPEKLPELVADPLKLETLLVNLLDNAVKYTEKGSAVLRLGIRNGCFMIEVEDTGIGISSEHLPRIFERFYVVDKSRSRKVGGTGLGLAIVKHIVDSYNGKIEVISQVGKGTTVTILLPL